MRFGEILRRIRAARSLSSRELARRARLPLGSISHYENGRQMPRRESLRRIARVLCVDDQLLVWFLADAPRRSPRGVFSRVDTLMLDQVSLVEKESKRKT